MSGKLAGEYLEGSGYILHSNTVPSPQAASADPQPHSLPIGDGMREQWNMIHD